ncbi:uncharacterized protein LOC136083700 [Hydra vulgaris]|uniref:Uncharacterized protein LOC136083700 n=1 Tax=Hydra vulgaris TaxID=6087 RepID=A0ABM4CCG1_HYDVU
MPRLLFKKNKYKRSHEDNQRMVCACCHLKDLNCIPINLTLEKLIKEHINPNYSRHVFEYPTGICSSCKSYMYKLASNNPIPINVTENWTQADLMFFKSGRDCVIQCTVCSMDHRVLEKTKARIEKSKSEKPLILCPNCFCNFGKGLPHKSSPGQEKVNISSHLSSRSSKVQQQVTSTLLKNIYTSSRTNLGEEIIISTGGPLFPVKKKESKI